MKVAASLFSLVQTVASTSNIKKNDQFTHNSLWLMTDTYIGKILPDMLRTKRAASCPASTCVWVVLWGGVSSGARASQRVTRPEERRGEREGQHHRMPQTDWRYFYWAPRRGPGCNYTTHTHTHTHIHACTHTVTRQTEKGARLLNSVSLFLSLYLIIVLCPPWHPLPHTWTASKLQQAVLER